MNIKNTCDPILLSSNSQMCCCRLICLADLATWKTAPPTSSGTAGSGRSTGSRFCTGGPSRPSDPSAAAQATPPTSTRTRRSPSRRRPPTSMSKNLRIFKAFEKGLKNKLKWSAPFWLLLDAALSVYRKRFYATHSVHTLKCYDLLFHNGRRGEIYLYIILVVLHPLLSCFDDLPGNISSRSWRSNQIPPSAGTMNRLTLGIRFNLMFYGLTSQTDRQHWLSAVHLSLYCGLYILHNIYRWYILSPEFYIYSARRSEK